MSLPKFDTVFARFKIDEKVRQSVAEVIRQTLNVDRRCILANWIQRTGLLPRRIICIDLTSKLAGKAFEEI